MQVTPFQLLASHTLLEGRSGDSDSDFSAYLSELRRMGVDAVKVQVFLGRYLGKPPRG